MYDFLDLYFEQIVMESQTDDIKKKQCSEDVKKTIDDAKKTQKNIKKAIALCLVCIGLGIWLSKNHSDKEMYKHQVEGLKNELENLKKDQDEMKIRIGKVTKAANSLNETTKEQSKKIDELSKRSIHTHKEITTINGKISDLNDELKTTRQHLKKTNMKLGDTVKSLEHLKTDYEKNKEKTENQFDKIKDLMRSQNKAIKATGAKADEAKRNNNINSAISTIGGLIASSKKESKTSQPRLTSGSQPSNKRRNVIDAKFI